MTNAQIILGVMALEGINEELHTFNKWKSLGFKVKQGEHGIETKLWKYTKNKKKKEEAPADADEETKKQYNNGFYLAKSYLFRQSQVEKIEETK